MFRPLSLLLLVLLSGCSKTQDELIGTWVAADPGFPGIVTPQLIFSPDGTGRVVNGAVQDMQMNWRRLDRARFTFSQANGATWAGCLAEGRVYIRVPSPPSQDGRARRSRYQVYRRPGAWHDKLVFRERSRPSGLACRP